MSQADPARRRAQLQFIRGKLPPDCARANQWMLRVKDCSCCGAAEHTVLLSDAVSYITPSDPVRNAGELALSYRCPDSGRIDDIILKPSDLTRTFRILQWSNLI